MAERGPSDRALLRLAFVALAAFLLLAGVDDLVRAGDFTREEALEQECTPAPEGGLGVCSGPSSRSVMTAKGHWLQAVGFLQIACAGVLLVFQQVRWSAGRVGAWLPRTAPVTPPSATVEATPAEPWRDL